VTSDYELLLVITLSETRFITRISSEPVPYFHVPHRLTAGVTSDSFVPPAVEASCSICCALDSPVSLAVDSDAGVPSAAEPRVTILANPDIVVRIQGYRVFDRLP
jgi:hypothetical protein